MTTRHRASALAIAIALSAATAACTSKDNTVTDVPVSTVADAKSGARTKLDTIINALLAVAPDAVHPPYALGLAQPPCGENGPAYQITATDQVQLPGNRHHDVLAAARDSLTRQGFTITASRDFADGGAELHIVDPAGYDATITSNKNATALAIILTTPCMITPDGTYPA